MKAPDVRSLKRVLWTLIILSLIPASILVSRRIQAEGRSRSVTIVMDELALSEQAEYLGTSSFELARRYQALGLNGIALYEDTFESLQAKGKIALLFGSEAINLAISNGELPPNIPTDSMLISELESGAFEQALAKVAQTPQEVTFMGRDWYVFPGAEINERPAGIDPQEVARWADAGFDIAYRPRNFPYMQNVGQDFPAQAHYLIYAGLQVAGHPSSLDATVAVSQNYITGIIEGTVQDGMKNISSKVPTARLLSFNQDYINQRLFPNDLIDKYLLAANERGIRILYVRPYTETQLGDMVENTEKLVSGLRNRLEQEGYTIAPLGTLELDYQTSTVLRALSSVGVLAGLVLLALMYPGVWGVLVSAGVAGLGIFAGGFDWNALALMAALTFPVIGYGHLPERLRSLGVATLISLCGAALLAAVGSDREAMLAISPFAGVAATLVVPPVLYLFYYALKYRPPVNWIMDFWQSPIRIGNVVIVFMGLAALAVVFLRRGNFPVIGVSNAELQLRTWLSDLFVRPRFKELLGHPLAVLGLTNDGWLAWIRACLLTGGVIAQASILNSFSHYHTPLIISFQRTIIALVIGLVIGLILVPVARLLVQVIQRWLRNAPQRSVR